MFRNLKVLLPCILLSFVVTLPWPTVEGAKILGLFAHPSESHFNVMRSVVMELARRNHNVTVISSHRLDERVENLEEIIVEPGFEFWHELQKTAGLKNDLVELSQQSSAYLQISLATVGAAATEYFLLNDRVQKILQTPTESFDYDLIIVDLFYTEALLMFGEHFQKPVIALASSNFEHYMTLLQESIVPVACSPINFNSYTREIGFWHRLSNTRECLSRRRQFANRNSAAQQRILEKFFKHYKGTLPTIAELQANIAVLLFNNHVPLATPQPQLQNTIFAGGLHVRPPRELPWHIRRFLDEARIGVIYMNLGNELQCKDIPKATMQLLLNVLGKAKENVLLTCHDNVKELGIELELPKNIMIQHMVPQTDILAHPHVKLFLMNGDLLSLQEGILRHVPMVGVPLFREEHDNMDLAVRLGVGLKLDYTNLTEVSLSWAVQSVLLDSTYQVTIRKVSTIFRDRPLGALETCVYWVDYVLRHNGAAHVRTLGVGIASNHLHLFDLFIYYFVMSLVIVGILIGFYFVAMTVWTHRQGDRNKVLSKLF